MVKASQQLVQIPTRTQRRLETQQEKETEQQQKELIAQKNAELRQKLISENLELFQKQIDYYIKREKLYQEKKHKASGERRDKYDILQEYYRDLKNLAQSEGIDLIKEGYTRESVRKYIRAKAVAEKREKEEVLKQRLEKEAALERAKAEAKANQPKYDPTKEARYIEIETNKGTSGYIRQEQKGRIHTFRLEEPLTLKRVGSLPTIEGITFSEAAAEKITPDVQLALYDIRLTQAAESRLGYTEADISRETNPSTKYLMKKALVSEKKKIKEELDKNVDAISFFSKTAFLGALGKIEYDQKLLNKELKEYFETGRIGKTPSPALLFTGKIGVLSLRTPDVALSYMQDITNFLAKPTSKKITEPIIKTPKYLSDEEIGKTASKTFQNIRNEYKTFIGNVFGTDLQKIVYSKGARQLVGAAEVGVIAGQLFSGGYALTKRVIKPKAVLKEAKLSSAGIVQAQNKIIQQETKALLSQADDVMRAQAKTLKQIDFSANAFKISTTPKVETLTYKVGRKTIKAQRTTASKLLGYKGTGLVQVDITTEIPKAKWFNIGKPKIKTLKTTQYFGAQISPTYLAQEDAVSVIKKGSKLSAITWQNKVEDIYSLQKQMGYTTAFRYADVDKGVSGRFLTANEIKSETAKYLKEVTAGRKIKTFSLTQKQIPRELRDLNKYFIESSRISNKQAEAFAKFQREFQRKISIFNKPTSQFITQPKKSLLALEVPEKSFERTQAYLKKLERIYSKGFSEIEVSQITKQPKIFTELSAKGKLVVSPKTYYLQPEEIKKALKIKAGYKEYYWNRLFNKKEYEKFFKQTTGIYFPTKFKNVKYSGKAIYKPFTSHKSESILHEAFHKQIDKLKLSKQWNYLNPKAAYEEYTKKLVLIGKEPKISPITYNIQNYERYSQYEEALADYTGKFAKDVLKTGKAETKIDELILEVFKKQQKAELKRIGKQSVEFDADILKILKKELKQTTPKLPKKFKPKKISKSSKDIFFKIPSKKSTNHEVQKQFQQIETLLKQKQTEAQVGAILPKLRKTAPTTFKEVQKYLPTLAMGVSIKAISKELQKQMQPQVQRQTNRQNFEILQRQLQRQFQKQFRKQMNSQTQRQAALQKQLQKQKQRQLQALLQRQKTKTTPIIPRIPHLTTTRIPNIIIPINDFEKFKKKSQKNTEKKLKEILKYAPSFTAAELQLKPKKISEKELRKLLKQYQTGLGIRRAIIIK